MKIHHKTNELLHLKLWQSKQRVKWTFNVKSFQYFCIQIFFQRNCPTAVLSTTQNNSVPICFLFFSEVSEELKMKYETCEIFDM